MECQCMSIPDIVDDGVWDVESRNTRKVRTVPPQPLTRITRRAGRWRARRLCTEDRPSALDLLDLLGFWPDAEKWKDLHSIVVQRSHRPGQDATFCKPNLHGTTLQMGLFQAYPDLIKVRGHPARPIRLLHPPARIGPLLLPARRFLHPRKMASLS